MAGTSKNELVDSLMQKGRLRFPRELKPSYLGISSADDSWIEVYFGATGEVWKISLEKIKDRNAHFVQSS